MSVLSFQLKNGVIFLTICFIIFLLIFIEIILDFSNKKTISLYKKCRFFLHLDNREIKKGHPRVAFLNLKRFNPCYDAGRCCRHGLPGRQWERHCLDCHRFEHARIHLVCYVRETPFGFGRAPVNGAFAPVVLRAPLALGRRWCRLARSGRCSARCRAPSGARSG